MSQPAPPANVYGQIVIGRSPGPSWIDLRPLPENVAAARLHTETVLSDHDEDHVYTVALVVSELITNAVLAVGPHIPTRIGLGVQHCARYDHIYVQDPVPQAPVPRDADDTDENGRGLHIIEAYAAVLWADPRRHDKTVHAVMTHPGVVLSRDEIEQLVAR